MLQRWSETEAFLIERAEGDIRAGGGLRPCLAAFHGDEPLLVAFSRPFDRGGFRAPLIELLALAALLDADRLALSMGGRAWHLDDPPRRSDGADPRRAVLAIQRVDGHRRARPRQDSLLLGYELAAGNGGVRWDAPLRPGPAVGWVADALILTVRGRARLQADSGGAAEQALRCARLGHLLMIAPEGRRRLAHQPDQEREPGG